MEAAYYEKLDSEKVRCTLCPNFCVIAEGMKGRCRVRSNHGGLLSAYAYGRAVTLAVDPIEKKPLYHFHPSKQILSTGANGCNLRCEFCQNYEISQQVCRSQQVEPEDLARMASRDESIGVAYTYTEPFIWFEYIRDAGLLVRDRGLVNVLVTNGYVNEEPLNELLPLIDAMNIDIKSMNPDFYSRICGGKLDDVLRTVEIASGQCHVEVTNLVVTNTNDSDEDIEKLVDWLYSINPSIPLHLSRYFPRFKFGEPPTSPKTMQRAYNIASAKLKYVYVGNIGLEDASDTRCPHCESVLVNRSYYSVAVTGIENSKCASCGSAVDFVGV